jgi:hypothetical protein
MSAAIHKIVTFNDSCKKSYAYRPLRNALVSMSWKASTDEAKEMLLELFVLFTEARENLPLFGTAAVREALVSLARHASTAAQVTAIGQTILHITVSDENEALFAIPSVRNEMVSLLDKADCPEAIVSLCGSIVNFAGNDEHRHLFATHHVRDALVKLVPFASVADPSILCVCQAITTLTIDKVYKALFGTPLVRDALVLMGSKISDADAAEWVFRAIISITMHDACEQLFCTNEIREMLIGLAAVSDTPDSQKFFCGAIINLTSMDEHKRRFSVPELREALAEMMKSVARTSSNSPNSSTVEFISRACFQITKVSLHADGFGGSRNFRSAFCTFTKQVSTSEGVRWCGATMSNIFQMEDNKFAWGTVLVRDAIAKLAEHARSSDSVIHLSDALHLLTTIPLNVKIFAVEEIRDAFTKMCSGVGNAASTVAVCRSISLINITPEQRELYAANDFVKAALFSLVQHCSSADAVHSLASLIHSCCSLNLATKLQYANRAMLDALLVLCRHAHSALAVRSVSRLVNVFVTPDINSELQHCIVASPLRQQLIQLQKYASTSDAIQPLSHAVSTLTKWSEALLSVGSDDEPNAPAPATVRRAPETSGTQNEIALSVSAGRFSDSEGKRLRTWERTADNHEDRDRSRLATATFL